VKKVADTQAVIDSVVAYITSVNYKDFPDVVAMVEDATDQLNKIKDAKAKHEDAAKKKTGNRPTSGPSRSGSTR
jgi:nitrous-oxide reductase